VLFGHDEVMHHAGIWRVEILETCDAAMGIERAIAHPRREWSPGGIAEEHQFASGRIGLGMGGKRPLQRTEILHAARCQGDGVDLDREMRFFKRQQAA
jgi:hypothetical protein